MKRSLKESLRVMNIKNFIISKKWKQLLNEKYNTGQGFDTDL